MYLNEKIMFLNFYWLNEDRSPFEGISINVLTPSMNYPSIFEL